MVGACPGKDLGENCMNSVEKLNSIFEIFDDETECESFFCSKGCSSCCTNNVIITSLELENLLRADIDKTKLLNFSEMKRFQPKTTTNMIADLVMGGENIPEEDNDSSWGSCVFLKDGVCSVYEFRPFGCRCMLSKVNCEKTGCAEIDPYLLTLNNVFLQFIEHLDHGGVTGNILDMVLKYDFSKDSEEFVKNRKMSVLMVPGEHRDKISKVARKLSQFF